MKPTQQLREEHEGIKLMLAIMGKMFSGYRQTGKLNEEHLAQAIDFIRVFADGCHHGKEEGVLFPALVKHGLPGNSGPVAVMMMEHDQGRRHIQALAEAFEDYKAGKPGSAETMITSANAYIDLLSLHIEKENNILFPMADKLIEEKENDEILEAFDKVEDEKAGQGKHEEYHRLLRKLKEIYQV